jgi:hypothetical protein
MERHRRALVLMLLFVLCTGIAIVLSGSRPASDQGSAPWVAQAVGYLSALAGGVLLLTPRVGRSADDRATGSMVVGAAVVLALVDAVTVAADSSGADIGAGLVRVVGLVVIMVATVRLALGVAASGRAG